MTAEGPSPILVSYDTQLADYRELYRLALARRYPRFRYLVWALVAVALVLLAVAVVHRDAGTAGLGVALLVLWGLMSRVPHRLARRRWRRDGSVRYEAEVGPLGFTGTSLGATTSLRWPAVGEIRLTPSHLYLDGGEAGAVIALRALPPPWTPDGLYRQCLEWRAASMGR